MTANITGERHNDDLFEVGNGGAAHFDHARVEASRTRLWESHKLLLGIALVSFIFLIVDRLTEVHSVSVDLWIIVLLADVPLSIGFGLHLLLNGHDFGQKRILFLGRLLDSFALRAHLCGLCLGSLSLLPGSLLCILLCLKLGFINVVAHGLIIFD